MRSGFLSTQHFSAARAGEARRDGKPAAERLQASTTRAKPNACRTRPRTLHANGPGPDAKLNEPGRALDAQRRSLRVAADERELAKLRH